MNSQHSNSDKNSDSFNLLDSRIQRWIWQSNWTELKDAQERAIPVILGAEQDVVIAAATASGKTEAAFLPILTKLLSQKKPGCVVYISPLKALINDQWDRLDKLCQSLEIPVYAWHGDSSLAQKKKFTKTGSGCLLITPESLEGLLMRQGHSLPSVFGKILYVVVDELHAFIGSERGKQLQSLLHRLETGLNRKVPRIALSATLGDMRLAAEFLRPGHGDDAVIIESKDAGQELRVIVKGFYLREKADDPTADKDEDAFSRGLDGISDDLYKNLRGSNNLVFPNSRTSVETIADKLRRKCEAESMPNEFWPHHGSLSKGIREETEQALKSGERPATAIATTTLELGIDIGSVKSIAQINSAPSVASLRQRLGRSGRRKGDPAILRCYCLERETTTKTPIPDQLREGLVETIAQIRLLVKGWYEPPLDSDIHQSTLIQQLLSLIGQYGGITPARAWGLLCESGSFKGLSKAEFAELLKELGRREILMQDATGLLLHGPAGDRIVNHFSFLAAFSSDDEFRVVTNGKTLGTLPLSRPVEPESYIIFAGRRWQVISCDQEAKVMEVKPAKGGKPPIFDGMGGKVHKKIREEMRAVLTESAPIPFLDKNAALQLSEARGVFASLRLDSNYIVQDGINTFVFTWASDWVNDTLALMLGQRGCRALNEGICLTVMDAPVETLKAALTDIANEPNFIGTELVANVQNKEREKWDHLLPPELLSKGFAARELDIHGAVEIAAKLSER